MPTIISDAIEQAGAPLVAKRPTLELLAGETFGPEASFFLNAGVPYVVWPDWDYAEYWGPGRMREVHPFGPIIGGTEVSEAQFRAAVLAIHAPGDPPHGHA